MSNPYYFYYGKYLRPFVRKEPQKTYTVAVMSLLTVMLFGVFAIAPTVKSILKASDELTRLSELSANLNIKIENVQKARLLYAQAKPFEEALDSQIYVFEGWGRAVGDITALANEASLAVAVVDPGLIINNEGFLQVKLSGAYLDIELFLEGLTKKHRNYSLDKLVLEKNEDNSNLDESQVEAEVLLKVLFL
ncbi:MAG: hypothetical protein ABH814_01105 [bacterium]